MSATIIQTKRLEFPLIQGGMGVGVSLSTLAGAVMKEGCMGVLSAAQAGYREPDFRTNNVQSNCDALINESIKARAIAKGKGLLGINIMVASKDYVSYVKAALKAQVDAIISGAGLPLELPKLVEGHPILLAPIVSSAKAIRLLCKVWDKRYQRVPDFVVIEGALAGGHLGFKKQELEDETYDSLDVILQGVLHELNEYKEKYHQEIPVFVAGGIYTGQDIQHFIHLGATGVQMGTRFMASYECDASDAFKDAVMEAKQEDIILVNSPAGFPGRALNNAFVKKVVANGNRSISSCLSCMHPCNPSDTPYCISEALIQSVQGKPSNGLVFVGSNAYRLNKREHVKDIIDGLKQEYLACGGK